MVNFDYVRVTSPAAAVSALVKDPASQWIAGGTNLVDLMKKGVTAPQKIIDINGLPLKEISRLELKTRKRSGKFFMPEPQRSEEGPLQTPGIQIGALALNSDVADDDTVRRDQPLLALALQAGASQQIRNMATIGGNLMQRTRCPYFYNPDMPCNKRQPGSGCGALKGFNRMHAIFGASDKCIAVHPSDMAVALAALEAIVLVTGPKGDRRIPFADFHRLPEDAPHIDNTLERGELITTVEIPDNPFGGNVWYLKVRDRSSYAFALVSVAAAADVDGDKIRNVRLAMGGVAHKPWRLTDAEDYLQGRIAGDAAFRHAANLAMQSAKGYGHNNFKLQLGAKAIVEALKKATGRS